MGSLGRIWIFGRGAFGSRCLPSGLASRMGKLDRIFTTIREPASLWMPLELRDVDLVRLHSEYSDRAVRLRNYQRISAKVIDGAKSGQQVAYFTYGSPVVFDRVVSLTLESAKAEGIACRVVPAASSVDALLAFIGQDMAPGLQICEARSLAKMGVKFDPLLPVLLFQVGFFATDGIPDGSVEDLRALSRLREYLAAHYPDDHPALFVRAPLNLWEEGYIGRRTIGGLEKGSVEDLHDTSLFIPAIELHRDGLVSD